MKFNRSFPFIFLISFSLVTAEAETEKPLHFEEVYKLIKTNLRDISEQELSRLAAVGFLKELGNKVQLEGTNNSASAEGQRITRKAVYNDFYGYVRVGTVASGLADEMRKAIQTLTSTNRLRGIVLDLRYAAGQDYAAATEVADLFVERPDRLLKVGDKQYNAKSGNEVLKSPLAILVNEQTRGAAEAIAAILRLNEAGLVIGTKTAGEARVYENFELSTGQQIKLGTVPVLLANNEPIPANGIVPDITVALAPEVERIVFEDPFNPAGRIMATGGGTNDLASSTNRSRPFNEAELVRQHREGADFVPFDIEPGVQPERHVILDPVLARSLDFLKGISVLQQFRPE